MGTKGTVGDDSEPLELKKHAPLQLDNMDMRINVLKEYISKVPGAKIKDLKKALTHFSAATDEEFKELIKTANIDKYNELFPVKIPSEPIKKSTTFFLPQYTLEEVICMEKYRGSQLSRTEIYDKFKKECPRYPRKIQFVSDYFHNYPQGPPTRFLEEIKNPPKSHVIHTQISHVSTTNSHILAQAINSLYKSGKPAKLFSEIKPVIELIEDPNEVAFAIECLTS
jgi:hypothetical protein